MNVSVAIAMIIPEKASDIHRDHFHPGQPYHAHNTLLVGQYGVRIVTLVLSSSGSLSEHQPVQWLQTLQFHSVQDCGREYSRISASRENQLMGQSVRFNTGLCHHYESVELENVSVAMAMIIPEKVSDIHV